LPRVGHPLPEAKPQWDFLPGIDWFWVKAAAYSEGSLRVGLKRSLTFPQFVEVKTPPLA